MVGVSVSNGFATRNGPRLTWWPSQKGDHHVSCFCCKKPVASRSRHHSIAPDRVHHNVHADDVEDVVLWGWQAVQVMHSCSRSASSCGGSAKGASRLHLPWKVPSFTSASFSVSMKKSIVLVQVVRETGLVSGFSRIIRTASSTSSASRKIFMKLLFRSVSTSVSSPRRCGCGCGPSACKGGRSRSCACCSSCDPAPGTDWQA